MKSLTDIFTKYKDAKPKFDNEKLYPVSAVLDIIDEVLTQEWISVSDQKPPLNQNVLVYHPEHDIVFTDCYKEHDTLNGKQAYFTHTGITDWAPYPKGPKK